MLVDGHGRQPPTYQPGLAMLSPTGPRSQGTRPARIKVVGVGELVDGQNCNGPKVELVRTAREGQAT